MTSLQESGESARLKFRVKTDLVLGGRICSPGGVKLADVMQGEAHRSPSAEGPVTGFYLAAWPGGSDRDEGRPFSLSRMSDAGVADVDLRVRAGRDSDVVCLAVVMGLATPKCVRCCHLMSTFVERADLVRLLSEPGRRRLGFTADQACVRSSDNFTRNLALHRVLDCSEDLGAYSTLSLRASSLLRLEEGCAAVQRLGAAVEQQVLSCAVCPMNAGCQFVQSFTYGHMAGHLTHYALLGHLFDSLQFTPSLGLLLYNFYQAMHSTNLGFPALSAMPDAELVPRFALPMLSRHTACALTNVYCPDVTLGVSGQACKLREAEDIAKSFSRLNFEVQNAGRLEPYAGGADLAPTMADAVRAVVDSQMRVAALKDKFGAARKSPVALADDCENTAQLMQQKARELLAVFKAHKSAKELAAAAEAAASQAPALFGSCTREHHALAAEVLWRLGGMMEKGQWSLALAVASAKGPSYTENSPQPGAGLCGHGACIARVLDARTGTYLHYPVEGTTYLTVDVPPPEGYPATLPLKMATGAVQTFPLETVATVLAQNVHELVGLSVHAGILAHLRRDYGESALACPFYVSTFYTSLSEGRRGSLGCIPLDTKPPTSFQAGSKPVFGAPVMGLSNPATVAIPVTSEMLADARSRPGPELEDLLARQVNEAYGPSVTGEQLAAYMSYLQPVESPDQPGLDEADYATALRSENTWAYDDPQVARKAVQVYQSLAMRFDILQAADGDSDGARATAYGQYLSACLCICLPVPRDAGKFSLSTVRNLRQAAQDVGLTDALAACVFKQRAIGARAAVESEHHVYMCERGEGFVHAHRAKLAVTK